MTYDQEAEYSILANMHTRRRPSRISMYTFLTLSGIASMFFPSQLFATEASPTSIVLWSLCFVSTAVVALVSAVFEKWRIEWAMLPLLIASFIVFGSILFYSAVTSTSFLALPYSLFFGAFASGLVTRWKDLTQLNRKYIKILKEL